MSPPADHQRITQVLVFVLDSDQAAARRPESCELKVNIADVSEFMTLAPGDLLFIGVAEQPARARAGDTMAVEIDGIGRLENPLHAEAVTLPEAA